MRFITTLILLVTLFGCKKSDDDNIIIDYEGRSEYIVNNKSDTDLKIIFTTSEELGFEIDSSNTVNSNNSQKIFEDGAIGINPTPINSFSEIKFYATNNEILLLTFSPISNDDWIIFERDFGESEFGLTKYELVINNEDLE